WWLSAVVGAVAPVLGIALIHAHGALTTIFRHVDDQAAQGRRAAPALVLLAVAAARAPWVIGRLEALIAGRRVVRAGLIGAALAMVLVGIAVVGHQGLKSLGQSRPHFAHGDLNLRFLTLSPNGRGPIWRVAADDFKSHPVLGSGAG